MGWEDIRLVGKPEFDAFRSGGGSNLFLVSLSVRPDEEWWSKFDQQAMFRLGHKVLREGEQLHLIAPPGELAETVDSLKAAIATANANYRADVLPGVEEAGRQTAEREEERRTRIQRAEEEAASIDFD